jgi:hypothetical protein
MYIEEASMDDLFDALIESCHRLIISSEGSYNGCDSPVQLAEQIVNEMHMLKQHDYQQ